MGCLNKILWLFLTALCSVLFSVAAPAKITVENPTVFAAQIQQPSAVFMTLKNDGEDSVNLALVESTVQSRLELHGTRHGKMLTLNGIEIPARGQTELKRGGLHIMLLDVTEPLVQGGKFPLTLYFDNGEIIPVQAEIIGY